MTFIDNKLRVQACCSWLPDNKPRYVMGVGYPEDLVVSIALGADMFDCVWPSRTAVRPSHSPSTPSPPPPQIKPSYPLFPPQPQKTN